MAVKTEGVTRAPGRDPNETASHRKPGSTTPGVYDVPSQAQLNNTLSRNCSWSGGTSEIKRTISTKQNQLWAKGT